jgi:hypothetical protein
MQEEDPDLLMVYLYYSCIVLVVLHIQVQINWETGRRDVVIMMPSQHSIALTTAGRGAKKSHIFQKKIYTPNSGGT